MNRPAPQSTDRGTPLSMPVGMNRPAPPPEPGFFRQMFGALGQRFGLPNTATGPLTEAAKASVVVGGLALAAKGATDALQSFATTLINPSDDPAESIKGMGDTAKGVGLALLGTGAALAFLAPPLGVAVAATGALGLAAGALTAAFAELMKAADGMVERYGEYSPEIAQAQAIAEITQVLGDLRRSRQVGPDLVRYIQARTELQQRFEDQKAQFMEQVLPLLTQVLDLMSKGMDIASALELGVTAGFNWAKENIPGFQAVVAGLLAGILRNTGREPDEDWMTAVILGQRTPQFPFQVGPTGPAGGP